MINRSMRGHNMTSHLIERYAAIEAMASNGPITARNVANAMGINVQLALDSIKRLVRNDVLKEHIKIFENNNWQHTFVLANAKVVEAAPKNLPKSSITTRTDEVIAQIEEYLDEGEEICATQIALRLDLDINFVAAVFGKMIRHKIMTPMGKRHIDGSWHMFYQSYDKKPKQTSMLSSFQARRDSLVDALFGSYTPDPEAAWSFT